MTRKKVTLCWFLLLSQILIEPLKCQLTTPGAFFSFEGTGKPDSPKKDEMTLQREFFQCGMNAECSNIVTSATNVNSEETGETNKDKGKTNQKGTMWIKVPVPEPEFKLISRGKHTKQSTTFGNAVSSRAVDGNKNANWSGSSCTHTSNLERPHWWRVDFSRRAMIKKVVITNRRDCCSDRLNNFTIRIGFVDTNKTNPICRKNVGFLTGITTAEFKCNDAMPGRYMYIESHRQEALTLCEVEVYGYYF